MPRQRRGIAPDSLRTTEWQEQEYARLMGSEALERQKHDHLLANSKCTCKRRTVKVSGGFLTIHHEGCIKFKPWMGDYKARLE
jgi:hypothetical protein